MASRKLKVTVPAECLNCKVEKTNMRKILFLVLMAGMIVQTKAQTLPVGLPVVEDYMRRQQLLGDSTYPASLMMRPSFSYNYNDYSISANSKGFTLRAMPLVWKQQYITEDRKSVV